MRDFPASFATVLEGKIAPAFSEVFISINDLDSCCSQMWLFLKQIQLLFWFPKNCINQWEHQHHHQTQEFSMCDQTFLGSLRILELDEFWVLKYWYTWKFPSIGVPRNGWFMREDLKQKWMKTRGTPIFSLKWLVYFRENPIEMDEN